MSEMNNLKMAMEAFEDEIEGAEEYRKMHDMATDPALKKLFHDNMNTEKKHAASLLNWINAAAQQVLVVPG